MCVSRPLALLISLLFSVQLSLGGPADSHAGERVSLDSTTSDPFSAEAFSVNAPLTAATQSAFQISFAVTDQENATVLKFGIHPNASSGYDSAYDIFAPPPPPAGAFDARIRWSSDDYLTDIRKDTGDARTFHIAYQSEEGAGPIVLSWDPSALAGLGTFTITDDITGTLYGPLDMSSTSTLEISTAGGLLDAGVRITYTPPNGNAPPSAIDDEPTTPEDTPIQIDVLANDMDDGGLDPTSVTIISPPARGTISGIDVATGVISFVPDADYYGTTEFTYSVSDYEGVRSNTATVRIQVVAVNDAPIFTSTPLFTASENTPYEFVARTFDVDLDPISISRLTAPDWLSITDNGDGTALVSGTPGPLDQGPHDVTIRASDGSGGSVDLSFIILVTDNLAPTATGDFVTTNEDVSVEIDLLANDSDPEGDNLNPASVQILMLPSHGTISSVNPVNGKVVYTPTANFSGTDQFSYSVDDEHGGRSNAAVVEITVRELNDRPHAEDDTVSGPEDSDFDIDILQNDTDPDNQIDAGSLIITSVPANGSIVDINPATGRVVYRPDPDYFGSDSFSYTVLDVDGAVSNQATVYITINAVNDEPKFDPVAPASALRSNFFSLQVTAVDPDGDVISLSAITLPAWLSFSDSGNGTAIISGTPEAGNIGVHTVTLEARDPLNSIATQSFTITVTDNAPPDAVDDNALTDEDAAVRIDVLSNDSDPEGDALAPGTVTIVSDPKSGTVIDVDLATGSVTYLPDPDYHGEDSFSYIVSDITGSISVEARVVITVNPVNDAPIANPDHASTEEDGSVIVDLRSNDVDVDGDLPSALIEIVASPARGVLSDLSQSTGTVMYTPDPDFSGQDEFRYQITDSEGLSSIAQVTIQVGAVNDPVIFVSVPPLRATPSREYVYNVDTFDADGDAIVLSAVTIPSWLHFLDMGFGRALVSGTPELTDRGPHTIVIEANDGNGSIVHHSFVVRVNENAAPFGLKDTAVSDEDVPVVIDVLNNDVDPDGDLLDPSSVVISSPPANGNIISINPATGEVTYLPNPDYFGFDEFSYTVRDVVGDESNPARVELRIEAVNDAPVAHLDIAVTDEDSPVIVAVLYNDLDAEYDLISVVGHSGASHGSVSSQGDGSFRYVPDENFNGVDQFTYLVSDPSGAQSQGRVSIHVQPINDASEFVSTPVTAGTVGFEYLYAIEAYDLDGDALVFTLATQPDWISLEDYGDGKARLHGMPQEQQIGTHRVVLDVHDGTGTVRQIFSIIVVKSTLPAPPQVVLTAVTSASSPDRLSPRLSWADAPGATRYHVQLSLTSDSTFASPIFEDSNVLDTHTDVVVLQNDMRYIWRVRGINAGGAGVWSETLTYSTKEPDNSVELPVTVALDQNYPNPFNPRTTIPFDLGVAGEVTLTIFDTLGRRVTTLIDGTLSAGHHEVGWDASRLPSGVYLYRLQTNGIVKSRSLSLLR